MYDFEIVNIEEGLLFLFMTLKIIILKAFAVHKLDILYEDT